MSQLDNVLRRSIAHIDPADWQGRDRVFASAREAMIRLLRVYDPPLSADDIDRKIREFDDVVGVIEVEYRWARPMGDTLALAPPRKAATTLAALPPPEDEEDDEAQALDGDPVEDDDGLYTDEAEEADEEDYDDYDDFEADAYDDDEPPRNALLALIDRIGWPAIAAAAAVIVVIAAGSVMLAIGRAPQNATVAAVETPSAVETAAPVSPAAAPPGPPPVAPAPAEPAPSPTQIETPPSASGGLALETLVLFDGRDPGVFQSTSDNPVVFQGDQDGGFARISSSTTSSGARVQIGRGVYERIAGHRIRIVLVARASRTAPATSVRFAYQNGRVQSPWSEARIGTSYAPLSSEWSAPPERGGPANDSLIIEPGIPGDGTSIDVRSVRIEVLG